MYNTYHSEEVKDKKQPSTRLELATFAYVTDDVRKAIH